MWSKVYPATIMRQLYFILLNMYGNQGWWPAKDNFEVIAGAILTQRARWLNAERGLQAMKERRLLSPTAIYKSSLRNVAEALRPVGFYQEKARYLKNISLLIVHKFQGDLDKLLKLPKHGLREVLLSVKGIGPETADSIILYAAEKPDYTADTYTMRILNRLGLTMENRYMKIVPILQKSLPEDLEVLKEFHALTVKHGKDRCKTKPACDGCQLHDLCFYKSQNLKGVYSIGYSRLKYSDFIQKLKESQIQVLIDVRRFPNS